MEKVEQARNFANKIWNASRFALMNLEGVSYEDIDISVQLGTADRWILHRLNETARDITRLIDSYEFGETGRLLYNFIWDDLCDWYIEFAKLNLYGTRCGMQTSDAIRARVCAGPHAASHSSVHAVYQRGNLAASAA